MPENTPQKIIPLTETLKSWLPRAAIAVAIPLVIQLINGAPIVWLWIVGLLYAFGSLGLVLYLRWNYRRTGKAE